MDAVTYVMYKMGGGINLEFIILFINVQWAAKKTSPHGGHFGHKNTLVFQEDLDSASQYRQ